MKVNCNTSLAHNKCSNDSLWAAFLLMAGRFDSQTS